MQAVHCSAIAVNIESTFKRKILHCWSRLNINIANTHPSAKTTHRRPHSRGFLNEAFDSKPSLRALFILYSIELASPRCQEGIKPHRIGCTTQLLQFASSVTGRDSWTCLVENITGLQEHRDEFITI